MGGIDCRYSKNCKRLIVDNTCPLDNPDEEVCEKVYRMNQLFKAAELTEKQSQPIKMRLEVNSPDREAFVRLSEIKKNINTFVTGRENNLYLYSSITGNGKTYWATSLLQAYLETIWSTASTGCHALFISVPLFLQELKENINREVPHVTRIKDNIYSADLVIWDDIATKGFSVYETESLLSIINHRVEIGKANIYTSNLANRDLENAVGERLYSRVYEISEVIEFKGQDKRDHYRC